MKLRVALLAASLIGPPGVVTAQQSTNPSDPQQKSQDVPHQQPGSNNPDLQQHRKSTSGKGSKQTSGANNPSQKEQDVPHQQPETNNPDVGTQRHPTLADTSGTQQTGTKSKSKRKQHNSASTQTQTSSQN